MLPLSIIDTTNLPPQALPLVGREQELQILEQYLAAPHVRLINIVGPGGMGKTRLALATAARQVDQIVQAHQSTRFPDGIFFVGLAALTSADQIIPAIAAAVGFQLGSGATGQRSPQQQLCDYLHRQRLLLLLDNLEHLPAGVPLLDELLQAVPALTLLVTSRERLYLREEHLLTLYGLAFPSEAPATVRIAAEEALSFAAVQLFVQQARRLRPDWRLTDATAPSIAQICTIAEGMPLALELAAAWIDTLAPDAIAAEIQRSLDFLASDEHNIPARQRSVRAVFDSTWQRLDGEERSVFARLALFHSGFTRDAAHAVAGASLRMLARLISRSLLRYDQEHERYYLHELLRQYAGERLHQNRDEARRTAAAVGQFYLAFLDHWFTESLSQGISAAALAAIVPERENIRAVWGDILAQSDGETLRRVAHIIHSFYYVRGPYQEGAALIEQALARLRSFPVTPERHLAIAAGLDLLGWFHLREGQIGAAQQRFAESATIYAGLALPHPAGDSTEPLGGLGVVALVKGDYREAVRLGMAALERAEAEGHRGNQGIGLYVLVSAAQAQGQHRVAQRYAQRMCAIVEELGNRWLMAYCLIELGNIAGALGAYAEARQHYEAAYRLREEFADPQGMAVALAAQGKAALLEGTPAEAGQLYERSLALYRHLGDQGGLAAALDGLGRAHLARAAYLPAREALLEALNIASEMAFVPLQLAVLINIADLLLTLGKPMEGMALIRLVARHPASDHEANQRAQALLLTGVRPSATAEPAAEQNQDISAIVVETRQMLAALVLAAPTPAPANAAASASTSLVEPLTTREHEILRHIAAGHSNQEIAQLLTFSVGTVKWYSSQIYGKLGVASRTQAIALARDLGLLG